MNTDPIADMLTRIRNADHAGKNEIRMPYSKIKHQILEVMEGNHWIEKVSLESSGKFKEIKVILGKRAQPIVITRKSKPGQRIYIKASEISSVQSGLGIAILSTPKGVMSGKEAKKNNMGGEILCEIY